MYRSLGPYGPQGPHVGITVYASPFECKINMENLSKLKKWNTYGAIAHGSALILSIWAFWYFKKAIKTLSLKREGIDPTGTPPSQCNVDIPVKTVDAGEINFAVAIYAFFGISLLAHTFYATDGFGTGRYSSAILQGWNPYRWFEYAASAATMTAILAPADGTRDLGSVVTLATVTGALQFCGLVVEACLRYTQPKNDEAVRAATLTGWLLFTVIWFCILYNFANLKRDIDTFNANGTFVPPAEVPVWLWFILISQIVFYALFGVNQLQHIQKARTKGFSFETIEYRYIILSFLSKITLAGGFAYGLIYRTKDCP